MNHEPHRIYPPADEKPIEYPGVPDFLIVESQPFSWWRTEEYRKWMSGK